MPVRIVSVVIGRGSGSEVDEWVGQEGEGGYLRTVADEQVRWDKGYLGVVVIALPALVGPFW